MTSADGVALCALGENDLQAALHHGLGGRWTDDGSLAWSPAPPPHRFLLGAVTLRPDASPERITSTTGTVCDSFAEFDVEAVPGRVGVPGNVWMLRTAGPATGPRTPAGVTVRRVVSDAELSTWERVAFEANGTPPGRPGELYPPGSQHQRGVALLLAESWGEPVGTALAVVGRSSVTVSAVNVLAGERGRGIGSSLTAQTLDVAPSLPATLAASELGRRVYERLGFVEVGRPLHWTSSA